MTKQLRQTVLLVLATSATVGCAPAMVEATFGDAVRGNLEAQVYDPQTLTSPTRVPADGTDGMRMEKVMKDHRGAAGEAENVSNPIVINVGQ